MEASLDCTERKYVCASERVKLIGSVNGMFPDFGHHLENEMGGLWLHPVKLLDGFWLRFCDHTAKTVDRWIIADSFINKPYGNEFYYNNGLGNTEVQIKQFQFAPEEATGLIVSYEFYNAGNVNRSVSVEFLARTDLRPVWFSETVNIVPGTSDKLNYIPEIDAFHVKDSAHDWHVLIGSSEKPSETKSGDNLYGPQITSGKGTGESFVFNFMLEAMATKMLKFYIAGSSESMDDCMLQYQRLRTDLGLLEQKKQRYQRIMETCSLKVEDKKFEDIFNWIKINNDWMIMNVPRYGRGLSAGFPEYPWWFCCDNCYALQGVLAAGDFQLCRDTILLILTYSEKYNKNGKILHEVTTFGAVPNYGNTQETAHFITIVWKYYQWTGDWSLIERCIPYLSQSVSWLINSDDDGDLFPSGYGITEIAGLNMEMIDSAVYACEAYFDWAEICKLRGLTEESKKFYNLALKLKQAINEKFWSEQESLYCDCFASYNKIRENLDSIFEKTSPLQREKAEQYINGLINHESNHDSVECGWVLHKNWVVATPMEAGISPRDQAEKALRQLNTSEFIGEYGMYLNGLQHNETMTISTGVLAVAQAKYGYSDRALGLIERMFKSYSMATPGAISEMSPDYGCFVQAWTIYAAIVPIVCHFFGLQANAAQNCIDFAPCMPSAWNIASLQAVKIMNGTISVEFIRCGEKECYTINNQSGCALMVALSDYKKVYLNGALSFTNKNSEKLMALPENGCVTVEIEKELSVSERNVQDN